MAAATSQIVLPLSRGESWHSTSRNRPISSEAEKRHPSFGEEDGREGVLGEGEFVGPGDDDESDGVLGEDEVDIVVETLSEHLIVFAVKEKRYLFGLGTSTVRNSVTAVLRRMSNNTFNTRTAGPPKLFSIFCSTYLGSKSGPYRVILDRLSGQYREIWTGLGCRGLASCMATITCHVLNHYKLQEGCMNDPKQSTTRTEL